MFDIKELKQHHHQTGKDINQETDHIYIHLHTNCTICLESSYTIDISIC